ncbi:hypothetical protein LEP1GSC034_2896 [Leptospira interrogans str. 2003000735]|uniref:Uncharacterized protein n=5 Tax=Leptospira interrogans TaxID=173 RepID=M6KBP3_LEPIR|nr:MULTISPECIES: hypothetical protein [Leptospira]ALE38371.1 hypothetical protein G436_1165 [Leptospira interrogans serovar Hardjo str. Norma]EJP05228.1 hypothetical protein LEP1GSC007_1001 [Leptospira interrogans serovar Bulgarica str. Mallika]EKN86333.1 hypothetical protein LEP1GSC027_2255 [Leptospira interrogans str. 2002000624]EKO98887.1 hypothetical protein LEP1GSC057_0647 [Leptospira interrogans str. Brem 329]EKQ36434.1 hypothetical protein LEP1GSC025_1160 [Leptospira interrogans str. 20
MGISTDQPGNYFYRYHFFCPAHSSIDRNINVSHPSPERADRTQSLFVKRRTIRKF